MNGFLIINKSSGWTSHDVVQKARKILNTRKIGHLGTLDPLATGVLVLAVGEATKLVEYLMGCDKEYIAEITLGAESNTFDAEGEIVRVTDSPVTKEQTEKVVSQFIGEQDQVPPQFSAIKIGGQKACDLARKGERADIQPRKIVISSIQTLEYRWPLLTLKVECGSGTYIRSLAHDIGKVLGCGGYISALKRTRVGNFTLDRGIDIEAVTSDAVLPIDAGLPDFPKAVLSEKEAKLLKNGQQVPSGAVFSEGEKVLGILGEKCIGILMFNKTKGLLVPKKMMQS